jgi:hypothetical protein
MQPGRHQRRHSQTLRRQQQWCQAAAQALMLLPSVLQQL